MIAQREACVIAHLKVLQLGVATHEGMLAQ